MFGERYKGLRIAVSNAAMRELMKTGQLDIITKLKARIKKLQVKRSRTAPELRYEVDAQIKEARAALAAARERAKADARYQALLEAK